MDNELMPDMPLELAELKRDRHFTPLKNKIFDILNDLLQPEHRLKPDTAAREIDAMLPLPLADEQLGNTNYYSKDTEDFLWELWSLTVSIMGQVHHRHPAQDRMIKFMKSLTELPKRKIQLSAVLAQCTIWVDLPILGACMRDNLDYCGERNDREILRWINLSSFQARLLGSSLTGWTNFAIWAMRDALEEPHDDQAVLDCYVISMGEWIFYAGGVLFSKVSDQEPDERWCRLTRGGSLYNGKAGLCPERWVFWRSRALETSELVSSGVKPLALGIASRMSDIEKNGL